MIVLRLLVAGNVLLNIGAFFTGGTIRVKIFLVNFAKQIARFYFTTMSTLFVSFVPKGCR